MRRPGYEVLMLLVPEVAVDVAAFDEVGMAPDVVDLAALARTRIASALTSDDSRCETIIIVRPSAIRARLALTMASLSASSALVASSRIKMRGLVISARADRQALALAARQVGRSLVNVSVIAAGQALDEFLGACQAAPPMTTSSKLASGLPEEIVSWIRPAEQEILLRHHAETATQMRDVKLAQIGAVDFDQSFVTAVE